MLKEYKNKVQYLSYSTIYSAQGTKNIKLGKQACFWDILNRGEISKENYEIYLIRDPEYAIKTNNSNLCLLTLKELKKHIYLARRLFPFTYSVEETQYQNYAAFKVNIYLDNKHFYHRYLLTWVRYAYEFPFNVILNDALRMKHQYLNRESIPNLFVLCANSFNIRPSYYNSGHSISYKSANFLKEYELKSKIANLAKCGQRSEVNNLYPLSNCKWDIIDDHNGNSLDYWIDADEFETRAKIYLSNYKKLKKD